MRYGVYSIRDSVTGFINITTDVNDTSAKRNFRHAYKNTDSLFNSHSSDYTLYKIGYFDTETGIIEDVCPIENIVCADQFMREE